MLLPVYVFVLNKHSRSVVSSCVDDLYVSTKISLKIIFEKKKKQASCLLRRRFQDGIFGMQKKTKRA